MEGSNKLHEKPILVLGGESGGQKTRIRSLYGPYTELIRSSSPGGKTSLLANWVEGLRERYPTLPVIAHYTGSSVHSVDVAHLMRRCTHELKVPQELYTDPYTVRIRSVYGYVIRSLIGGALRPRCGERGEGGV